MESSEDRQDGPICVGISLYYITTLRDSFSPGSDQPAFPVEPYLQPDICCLVN